MRTSMPRYALALALFAASGLTYSANAASAESHDQTHDERQPTASSAAARQAAGQQTQALLALHKRWQAASGAARDQLQRQLLAKAEERRALLGELAEQHPGELLQMTIPEDKQRGMPAEVLAKLFRTAQRYQLTNFDHGLRFTTRTVVHNPATLANNARCYFGYPLLYQPARRATHLQLQLGALIARQLGQQGTHPL